MQFQLANDVWTHRDAGVLPADAGSNCTGEGMELVISARGSQASKDYWLRAHEANRGGSCLGAPRAAGLRKPLLPGTRETLSMCNPEVAEMPDPLSSLSAGEISVLSGEAMETSATFTSAVRAIALPDSRK